MNINNINTVAVPNTSGQVTTPPSSPVVGTTDSSSGAGKIQMMRPVEPMEKTEKKEEQEALLSETKTKQLVEELNEYMDDLQTNLGFSIREDLNHQVVVEIKNRKTDELVRQIPSEELLIIREKMMELSGFIFDQSV